ncbi:MAG: hypothetical protein KDI17_04770 [Halioglobus sp.]|nr:hypothetical protein [Halioglobus sp.]
MSAPPYCGPLPAIQGDDLAVAAARFDTDGAGGACDPDIDGVPAPDGVFDAGDLLIIQQLLNRQISF